MIDWTPSIINLLFYFLCHLLQLFYDTYRYIFSLEEKCRGFYTLTPGDEKGKVTFTLVDFSLHVYMLSELIRRIFPPSIPAMMWLSLSMELVYIGLLLISCTLLSMQLCIRAWFPSTLRWGQMLNAFAAIFTVLGGITVLRSEWHVQWQKVYRASQQLQDALLGCGQNMAGILTAAILDWGQVFPKIYPLIHNLNIYDIQ